MEIPLFLIGWLMFVAARVFFSWLADGWRQPAGAHRAGTPASGGSDTRQRGRPDVLRVSASERSQPNSNARNLTISVSGALSLGLRQNEAGIVPLFAFVRIVDGTDGGKQDVFSLSQEFQGEGMTFGFEERIRVPVSGAGPACTGSVLVELPPRVLCEIPLATLVPPKRGERNLVVQVLVVEEADPEYPCAFGEGSVRVRIDRAGYKEAGAHFRELECDLVTVAVAAAAADGRIAPDEIGLITRLFSARYAEDAKRQGNTPEQLKQLATAHLRSAVAAAQRAGSNDPTWGGMFEGACARLADTFLLGSAETAFEIATQIVAVDGQVTQVEDRFLRGLAVGLKLDEAAEESIRSRFIRIAMLDGVSDAAALGLPGGLSQAEKLRWLSKEYEKWRQRVTSRDPAIAAEAEERVARIARLRKELTAA